MAIAQSLRELVDTFSALAAQHVRLAHCELEEDARFVGLRVGVIAGLAPLVVVGYGFVCAALALLLSQVMPMIAALALIGATNLAVGLAGIARTLAQLEARKVMTGSVTEFELTAALARKKPEGRP